MATEKIALVVVVEVPRGTGRKKVRQYVDDAVGSWAKGGDPEDELWDLKVLSVRTAKPESQFLEKALPYHRKISWTASRTGVEWPC